MKKFFVNEKFKGTAFEGLTDDEIAEIALNEMLVAGIKPSYGAGGITMATTTIKGLIEQYDYYKSQFARDGYHIKEKNDTFAKLDKRRLSIFQATKGTDRISVSISTDNKTYCDFCFCDYATGREDWEYARE